MASSQYSLVQTNGLDRVNVTTANSQTPSDYVHFPSGGGLAVYTSNSSAVMVRLLDAQGEPTGAEVTLDASGASGGEATLLSNGNIAVTWDDGNNISAAIYSQDLQQIKASFTVFTGSSSNYYDNPEIVGTPDGGFVVAAEYAFSSSDYDIFTKKFDAAGNPGLTAYANPGSYDQIHNIAVAPNGNVLVAFRHFNTTTGAYELWTELYNQTLGTTIKNQSVADNAEPNSIQIVANPDNSFEIYYYVTQGSFDFEYALTVSSLGVASGTPKFLFYATSISTPAVGFSPTGQQFVLLPIHDNSASTATNDLYALLRNPDGSTAAFFEAVGLAGSQSNPQFGFLNAYTIQLVFSAGSNSAETDGSGNAVVTGRYIIVNTTTSDNTPELLTGSAVVDVMLGNGGNDTMDGAGGPDTMRGGAGNDAYYVDDGGDVVDEQAAGSDGYDTVHSWINYTLPDNVEALVLLGGSPLSGTGNVLNNYLQGNSANNWLDGSFGADLMRGFAGNDSYVVDNAGDTVDEFTPGSDGWDTVYSFIDYKLGPNVEALVLLGTLKLDGTGNGLANFMQGNGNANVLKAGGGNDTIKGLGGKDTIDGGGGSDTADYSDKAKSVSITLDGSSYATVKIKGKAEDKIKNVENLIGGLKADNFTGDSKSNTFDGGLGKDIFTGKDGKDKFVFSQPLLAGQRRHDHRLRAQPRQDRARGLSGGVVPRADARQGRVLQQGRRHQSPRCRRPHHLQQDHRQALLGLRRQGRRRRGALRDAEQQTDARPRRFCYRLT